LANFQIVSSLKIAENQYRQQFQRTFLENIKTLLVFIVCESRTAEHADLDISQGSQSAQNPRECPA